MQAPLFAGASAYRVLDVSGQAELVESISKRSRPLKARDEIPAGSIVQTGEKARVNLASDEHLESLLTIGPDSSVTFLNEAPMRLSLDEGSLFVLKETQRSLSRDKQFLTELRVLTREFLVSVREGGYVLEASSDKVVLKAFSEAVTVYPKAGGAYVQVPTTVEEGFRYTSAGLKRLTFPDYEIWQEWYKKNNEKKDRFAR